ncbi:MAG: PQQ-like beta-propeller repeat protein [Actinobacteria bacterium]|nr:PQQ-like beta-propeller repeat protein [Actinomycetota bacterium]MBU1492613.1 PQQ-like beta-propeller repeat protein [Actinomycetota bacterium]
MTRRGDTQSFLRSRRRRDFYERRSILPSSNVVLAVVMLACIGLAVYSFLRSDGSEEVQYALPPVVMEGVTTSTTPVVQAGTTFLKCPEESTGWATFQGSNTRSGCTQSLRTINEPEVLWQTEVGIFGWLNNPVISGNRVFVGSAGNLQFEGDDADGVYAIDLSTGAEVWHFQTENDVNGIAVSDDIVVATGDEGRVWGISASGVDLGQALWSVDIGISVFTNPLIIEGLAVVGDGAGEVTALDLYTGERRWHIAVRGPIRGGASSDGTWIYVISEEGGAAAVSLTGTVVWRQDLVGEGGAAIRVFAAPTVAGQLLIVPVVRNDLYSEPAIMALDKQSGVVRWRASDVIGLKAEWGNARSSPALIGTLLVYGETYSSHLVAIDVASGETRWSVEAGPFCYPHWSSPAITTGQVILARHDGGLYGIDAAKGELAWSIYLGDDTNGEFPDGYDEEGFCDWTPKEGSPVLASPAIAENGIVVVGSLQGILTAVGDANWGG